MQQIHYSIIPIFTLQFCYLYARSPIENKLLTSICLAKLYGCDDSGYFRCSSDTFCKTLGVRKVLFQDRTRRFP